MLVMSHLARHCYAIRALQGMRPARIASALGPLSTMAENRERTAQPS